MKFLKYSYILLFIPKGSEIEVEIALSLMVSEIIDVFQKSEISENGGTYGNLKFLKYSYIVYFIPKGSEIEVEIALSLTVYEIIDIF